MSTKRSLTKAIISSFIVLMYPLVYLYLPTSTVSSASLTSMSDTMTRQKISVTSSHTFQFTLGASTALDASETVTIDFDEDGGNFTVDGASDAIADYGFNDGTERTIVGVDGDCTGHSGANDIAVEMNDTTGVVTFTACGTFTSSASNATISIEIGTSAGGTNRVTNPGSATAYSIAIVAAADTGSLIVPILSDDQVVITASVSPSLSVALSSNTCVLGTLSTSTIETCNYNVTVTSNASGGYQATIVDDGNLRSPGGDDIDDVGVDEIIDAADIEEYGASTSSSFGSNDLVTYTDCNDGATTGDNQEATALTTTAQIFAGNAGVVNNDITTLCHAAAIDTGTQAGDYTHTATIIVTATY